MGVPVSVAGYLAAEAHEARRGAMDAAAAAACGFTHDSYAGLRGYGPGPDGMPPSVYGPGKFIFQLKTLQSGLTEVWTCQSVSHSLAGEQ
jgi:hypothetical protein